MGRNKPAQRAKTRGRNKNSRESNKFDRNITHQNGLACPFAAYSSDESTARLCHLEEGFAIGKIREHIKRCHAYFKGCQWCGEGWHDIADKKAMEKSAAHSAKCEWKSKDLRNPDAKYKQDRMNQEQWENFNMNEKLDREKSFEELYIILELPIPECYHVRPLKTSFLQGFQRPVSGDAPLDGYDPLAAGWVTQNALVQNDIIAQWEKPLFVAGSDAAEDNRDSGIGSSEDNYQGDMFGVGADFEEYFTTVLPSYEQTINTES